MPANAANRVIHHYLGHARELPWRALPGEPRADPYRVWLSEVMLQQTTVSTVAPRFERFVARWPTVDALAAAGDADVLCEWAGLGYYARARNLIVCAREVAARGGFPSSEADLRALPGIGDYSAAAIAAIAFGRAAAVVDTNVARVVARLHGLKQPSRSDIRALVETMTPPDQAGDFAQAMMDLGATICRPRAPECPVCPLREDCAARASGSPEEFPEPRVKRARPTRHGIARWIERDGALWLVRRPPRGMLGAMAALPGSDWTDLVQPLPSPPLAHVRHVFSHFALELAVVSGGEAPDDGWWQPLDRLGEVGLPTLYRRAAELVLARSEDRRAA
ncbi:A/G-specific adenine glycosylase [Sphingomonas sp.]|uniref:A/G-specific adenine glycosylase n=1 Tax=Sphingomonas sp. TaxID=28214 RepID=UPI001820B6CC|nr:A/G-specific adenine glycosylase [Sphingomonas sp.]MBA3511051.1 A/G-specific adenine glycosylase [Sphingomonas sp.]